MEVFYSKDKKCNCVNTIENTGLNNVENHRVDNYIADIVGSILRSQRSVCDTCNDCVSCDGYFCNALFNTIPVRLIYCGGNPVGGLIGLGGVTTSYFRIECLTHHRFVKLRLLSVTTVDGEIVVTGTNYTMVVDLDCICSIQCFEPANIEGCTSTTA